MAFRSTLPLINALPLPTSLFSRLKISVQRQCEELFRVLKIWNATVLSFLLQREKLLATWQTCRTGIIILSFRSRLQEKRIKELHFTQRLSNLEDRIMPTLTEKAGWSKDSERPCLKEQKLTAKWQRSQSWRLIGGFHQRNVGVLDWMSATLPRTFSCVMPFRLAENHEEATAKCLSHHSGVSSQRFITQRPLKSLRQRISFSTL